MIRVAQKTPTVIEKESAPLSELGTYIGAIKLEQTKDSIIGVISAVKQAANGDLLVGDHRSAEKVFRFDARGNYLTRYGKVGQGPGEYENLQAFTPLENGRVVLLGTYKILLYEADGTFVQSAPLGVGAHWVETNGSRLYVYATDGFTPLRNTILVYNQNLERIDAFHPYDKRIDKVTIKPNHALTQNQDTLYLSDFYDFRISAYDLDGNALHQYRLPSKNLEASKLWKKSGKLEKKEMVQLARTLHRINSLYAMNDVLLFSEVHFEDGVFRLNLLNTADNTLTRYPEIILIANKDEGYLAMSSIVGHRGNTLIGTIEDSAQFKKYQQNHTALKDVNYSDDDNALLLLFQLKAATS